VDFVIGTNSVLADGAVQAGQQVVVDGQEKLVDGGNVTPQLAPAPAPSTSSQPPPATPLSAHAGTHTNNGKGQP
jgi:hypothetical protein